MEESSREPQPRCPCGFWGSSKTLGLCSVCYRKAHRSQSQGSANIADAGKTAVGTCHSQSQNSNQGKRMDSKHFPSRSTADNLPSSLSSPPGERAALSAAPTSAVDTATPTTSGGAISASHLPAPINASGESGQAETASLVLPSRESLLKSDDSDLCSGASSDLSYEPNHDTNSYASDACAALVSVTGGNTTSENREECKNKELHIHGNQTSVNGTTVIADNASNSSTQSSDSTKTLILRAEAIHAVSNLNASSSKISAAKNIENGDTLVDPATLCDINSQTSVSRSFTKTNTCRNTEQASTDANISTANIRGRKRSRDEMEASSEEYPAPPPQMNKRRCHICSCKLELAQRTIGRCRCDRIFCALHRLPELHECEFNHKEDGRREAREKMVKPTRHLGPSYRREDPS